MGRLVLGKWGYLCLALNLVCFSSQHKASQPGVTSPTKVLSLCFLETGDQGAGGVGFLCGSSIGFFMVTFSGLVLLFSLL